MSELTPKEIVHELDRHIIGQSKAKRAVAIALRNRWRRMQLDDDIRQEVTPKNILMIGPTGVGKTEIARRLAKLANAPFIKVEATKFTEIGYVGKEVETIVRDLVDVAIKITREQEIKKVTERAEDIAEDKILDILIPPAKKSVDGASEDIAEDKILDILIPPAKKSVDGASEKAEDGAARQSFRKKLREGKLADKEIEINVPVQPIGVEIMAPPGMEEMTNQLQGMFQNMSEKQEQKKRIMKIKDALNALTEKEAANLINLDDLKEKAIFAAENNGIIFIDEIDKICKRGDTNGPDVSREGVQRDLLPLIEGSTVSTKHGMVKTDHMLFIASGAFQVAKPSDLIPELQGRLPIRVELEALTENDLARILTEPKASLTEQYQALLKTEGVSIKFTESGVGKIAHAAWQVNEKTENIGARRLHTLMECIMDEISYEACDRSGEHITINDDYVATKLDDVVQNEDLSRFIL